MCPGSGNGRNKVQDRTSSSSSSETDLQSAQPQAAQPSKVGLSNLFTVKAQNKSQRAIYGDISSDVTLCSSFDTIEMHAEPLYLCDLGHQLCEFRSLRILIHLSILQDAREGKAQHGEGDDRKDTQDGGGKETNQGKGREVKKTKREGPSRQDAHNLLKARRVLHAL